MQAHIGQVITAIGNSDSGGPYIAAGSTLYYFYKEYLVIGDAPGGARITALALRDKDGLTVAVGSALYNSRFEKIGETPDGSAVNAVFDDGERLYIAAGSKLYDQNFKLIRAFPEQITALGGNRRDGIAVGVGSKLYDRDFNLIDEAPNGEIIRGYARSEVDGPYIVAGTKKYTR